MKLAIACDHRGLLLKNALIDHLRAEGHVLIDFGTYTPESTDYPIYGERVGRAVRKKIACGELDAADFPLLLHIYDILTNGAAVDIPWEMFIYEEI